MTVRVVLADDEPMARRRLLRLLGERGDVEVVAECDGGRRAVTAIEELRPDLVLLDVQMPDLDGFGVIDAVGFDRMPPVVFVTAYDQYALRAFDVHAVDYLLKPYDRERFQRALDRAIARQGSADAAGMPDHRLRAAVRAILDEELRERGGQRTTIDRIAIRDDGRTRFIPVGDIEFLESADNYVVVHTATAAHRTRATLQRIEEQLDPTRFVRTHRRFVVNLDRVLEVQPWFAGDSIVLMRGGGKLRLSRTFREHFARRATGMAAPEDAAP